MAAGLTGRLAEAAARGVPIVGVESSCLLTLRDEYSALLPAIRWRSSGTCYWLPRRYRGGVSAETRDCLPRPAGDPVCGFCDECCSFVVVIPLR